MAISVIYMVEWRANLVYMVIICFKGIFGKNFAVLDEANEFWPVRIKECFTTEKHFWTKFTMCAAYFNV